MDLTQFLLSIIASLFATIIFLILAGATSRFFRRILTTIAAEWLGVEVKFRFDNTEAAAKDIKRILKRAHHVRIFTSRGTDFADSDLYDSLKEGNNKRKKTQLLMPNPSSSNDPIDWINQRDNELSTFDRAYGSGRLKNQIQENLLHIASFANPGRFDIRLYSAFHFGRLILTENSLFLIPYGDRSHGKADPVYWFGKGDIYDMFSRLFDAYWSVAVEYQPQELTKIIGNNQ